MRIAFLFFIFLANLIHQNSHADEGLPLYYWQAKQFVNFGDYLSLKLVERIVGGQVQTATQTYKNQKMLAIGSVLIMANDGDVIWGTGMNGKRMDPNLYHFQSLDVRAVRGPLTRNFLLQNFDIPCPAIFGDPALLLPYFFPEFQKNENPEHEYIIVPHYSEKELFPKGIYANIVYPDEPWRDVIRKILNSKFVISSSLHGLVVAEAYGIPARYLRITEHEPTFKYIDYYEGTNRPNFRYATTIDEALSFGGEPPFECDLKKLYESFPFEYWPHANYKHPDFSNMDTPSHHQELQRTVGSCRS
jgi:pyruvyltransferase